MSEKKSLPIWLFIGMLLLVYGIMCLGAGIFQFSHPPAVEMPNLHATFWGGVVLTLLGGGYVIVYWPKK